VAEIVDVWELDAEAGIKTLDRHRHGAIQNTIIRAMHLLEDRNWEEGLEVLKIVRGSITTTLFGELGGPMPPDFLLRLAVDTATPTRHSAAEALVAEEIATGSGRRYYSDLAEYRLIAARLAIAAGDAEHAAALWRDFTRTSPSTKC
jgi:hypothetical protein